MNRKDKGYPGTRREVVIPSAPPPPADPDYATCTDDDLRRLAQHANTARVRAAAGNALRARVTRTREDQDDDAPVVCKHCNLALHCFRCVQEQLRALDADDEDADETVNDTHARAAHYQHEATVAARERDAALACLRAVKALLDCEAAAGASRVDIGLVRLAMEGK